MSSKNIASNKNSVFSKDKDSNFTNSAAEVYSLSKLNFHPNAGLSNNSSLRLESRQTNKSALNKRKVHLANSNMDLNAISQKKDLQKAK